MLRSIRYLFTRTLVRVVVLALFSGLSLSATDCVWGDPIVHDFGLYYSIGGERLSSPANFHTDSMLEMRRSTSEPELSCGQFRVTEDVRDLFSRQLGHALTTLDSVSHLSVSSLPGSILCRARPGDCQLLQHYLVRAEQRWHDAREICRLDRVAMGNSSSQQGLSALSRVQRWQSAAKIGLGMFRALHEVDRSAGCIEWLGGQTAGCLDKPDIWLLQDTARAGWCLLLGQDADCERAPVNFGLQPRRNVLTETWHSPEAVAKWVATVLGDYRYAAGKPNATLTGSGLLSQAEQRMEQLVAWLSGLVYSARPPDDENLLPFDAAGVIAPGVIDALRDLPDRDLLMERLANEIALAEVVDAALVARRVLLSGLNEPHIQRAVAVVDAVRSYIGDLEREIEQISFEVTVRRGLMMQTALSVLQAHSAQMTPEEVTRRRPDLQLP